ncbi:DUF6118 family protein [Erythrobacter aureus]|uniref:Uncharacterized protein n=1 Tax=Erythrobacter aureus TaxID=2182384 RepID=A0A345YEC8_9SPHN|nr:DUF6118 family protein [Erythrobacter aureus]AXK42280.1 hypothetical protein DVR09_07950 [Erythrobacter aureus]
MEDDHIEEVQLDLEVEEPPALVPKPEVVTEADPATEAFARLEGEMAMVRHTVQNMARERADIVIPDYTATLGQMADQLAQVSENLADISGKPAIKLTPETIADQIAHASEGSRRYDSDQLMKAQNFHRQATAEMHTLVGRARTIEAQNRKLQHMAGAGLLAGILLWAILPGTIARAMPESWQWPEWMARKAVGEPTILEAGIRLIRSQNPEAWEELMVTHNTLNANRERLDRCAEKARKEERSVSCSIQLDPPDAL